MSIKTLIVAKPFFEHIATAYLLYRAAPDNGTVAVAILRADDPAFHLDLLLDQHETVKQVVCIGDPIDYQTTRCRVMTFGQVEHETLMGRILADVSLPAKADTGLAKVIRAYQTLNMGHEGFDYGKRLKLYYSAKGAIAFLDLLMASGGAMSKTDHHDTIWPEQAKIEALREQIIISELPGGSLIFCVPSPKCIDDIGIHLWRETERTTYFVIWPNGKTFGCSVRLQKPLKIFQKVLDSYKLEHETISVVYGKGKIGLVKYDTAASVDDVLRSVSDLEPRLIAALTQEQNEHEQEAQDPR